jgi:hypothetical protein
MSETLTRKYHGKVVVSTLGGGKDGWTHSVDGLTFDTLGEAVAHCKTPKPMTEPKGSKGSK